MGWRQRNLQNIHFEVFRSHWGSASDDGTNNVIRNDAFGRRRHLPNRRTQWTVSRWVFATKKGSSIRIPIRIILAECGNDFAMHFEKLQEDYYNVNNSMLRELKEGITKAEQLPEDGNIRKEIKRIKEVNNRLKPNDRGLPEDDLRDALLAMLPPAWDY